MKVEKRFIWRGKGGMKGVMIEKKGERRKQEGKVVGKWWKRGGKVGKIGEKGGK